MFYKSPFIIYLLNKSSYLISFLNTKQTFIVQEFSENSGSVARFNIHYGVLKTTES
jgi:hypothetical protein